MEPDIKELLEMHRSMLTIRRFEEEVGRIAETGEMPGFVHLYIGQEAVAVGVMAHLRAARPDHQHPPRPRPPASPRAATSSRMFAELSARPTGYCRGKGGSMHICDPELGMLGTNGIVGGGPPIAAGAAFANSYRGTDNVAVSLLRRRRAATRAPSTRRSTSPAC